MAIIPGTWVIGKVDFRTEQFAVVAPVYENDGTGWRPADPNDYPTRGRIFWWNPRIDVRSGSVIGFELAEGRGEPDRFQVTNADYLCPVFDYRALPYDEALERLTTGNLRVSDEIAAGKDVFVRCKDDLLLGPLAPKVGREHFFVPPDSLRLERVPYRENEDAVFSLSDGRCYCAPTSPVTGHLDCRPDAAVLRTAIRDAVTIAEKSSTGIPDFFATKALMQSAADLLREGERLDDRQYKYDRIVRALKICTDSDEVRTLAEEVAELLLDHPSIKARIDSVSAKRIDNAVAAARTQVAKDIEKERADLALLRDQHSTIEAEIAEKRAELDRAKRELGKATASLSQQLESLENSVTDRVAGLVDDATDLLTESVLLRALGVGSAPSDGPVRPPYSTADPFSGRRARSAPEEVPPTQVLHAAAESVGVNPTVLVRVHAAFRAGLIPIMTGNGGLAALSAYATFACGLRLARLPIAHDFLHPVDLLGIRASNPGTTRMHTGLLLGADAGVREGGAGVLVLESFNQAPTESYLMPWLQAPDRTIAVPDVAQSLLGVLHVTPDPDLLVAATATAGTTTAPLSPDIWGFAVAIDVPSAVPGSSPRVRPTVLERTPLPSSPRIEKMIAEMETALSSYCEVDDGVVGSARRLASGLAGFQSDGGTLSSIVECVLIPALASSLSGSDLAAGVDTAAKFDGSKSPDRRRALHHLARRLQRRFA
ncbi:hypothetical protein AAI421_08995 [Rhodococcus aetherivorans]|uniref:hypothetical protein n=1 Tax=Rhodococcus aetherivorans TaxID=191292 RepID=UPI000622C585|nr:hypothetical protein [Rhodococcus aetherivorans]AKE89966.1 hypothetical protein AAT18_12785 [Rhodococcus aetherivorans]